MDIKITIEYPQIMKMQLTGELEVSPDITLSQLKECILKNFWDTFVGLITPKIGIHGSMKDIELQDKNVIISTDQELHERLKKTKAFSAVFKQH